MGGQLEDQQRYWGKLDMTGEEDVEKSVIEHVINARERLSEMRDIVGQILIDKQSKMKGAPTFT
jgi:hypothetical protein